MIGEITKTTKWKCGKCPKEQATKTVRIPFRWRQCQEGMLCPGCFGDSYQLRCLTFPVVGPLGRTWSDLRPVLKMSFGMSTMLANWIVGAMFRHDVTRLAGMEKMPEFPKGWYGYGHAKDVYPDFASWNGAKQALNCLIRDVEKKYLSERYKVIWLGQHNLLRKRYPVPFPMDADAWRAQWMECNGPDKAPVVRIVLPAEEPCVLKLKGGPMMRRQLEGFRAIMDGSAIKGEAAIYQKRANRSGHGNGTKENGQVGGGAISRLMFKMVVYLPRKDQPSPGTKTLTLKTCSDCFWRADIVGRDPWILNADHVKRWTENHRLFLDRISDDSKFEKRWPRKARRNINLYREDRCRKFNNRIDTFVGQASAMLANYAKWGKVGRVVYDDSERSYLSSFRWAMARDYLQDHLRVFGIEPEFASGDVVETEE